MLLVNFLENYREYSVSYFTTLKNEVYVYLVSVFIIDFFIFTGKIFS